MGSVSLEPQPRLLGVLCGTDPSPGGEGGPWGWVGAPVSAVPLPVHGGPQS